jgi:hypothetical protein
VQNFSFTYFLARAACDLHKNFTSAETYIGLPRAYDCVRAIWAGFASDYFSVVNGVKQIQGVVVRYYFVFRLIIC